MFNNMFEVKNLREILFGTRVEKIKKITERRIDLNFPKKEEGDIVREISFASDDGLILYLIKRIEKIEEKLNTEKIK